MIETVTSEIGSETASYPACGERRRPNRQESVSPALIPLLRGAKVDEDRPNDGAQWDLKRPEIASAAPGDDLDTLKGILVAVAVGAAAWAVAIWVLPALVGPFLT